MTKQPFTFAGEANTYEAQKLKYSKDVRDILFSEIVLQAAFAVHYGYFPTQKLVIQNFSK